MKKEFISKYNVELHHFDMCHPLTVGNGNFAFTCDITGLQTFYQEYISIPLCTMSNLIWGKQKGEGDFPFQEYTKRSNGTTVKYMTNTQAETYDQYRDDFFKFDLFKLVFLYNGEPLMRNKITQICQKLILYEGKIQSEFCYDNIKVHVETKIQQAYNNLQIKIKTALKGLQIKVLFLNPSSNLCGSTLKEIATYQINSTFIEMQSDYAKYKLFYQTNMLRDHLVFEVGMDSFLSISLDGNFQEDQGMEEYFATAKCIDTKDEELNRRMVLSLYLMKVNTLGIYPPSETGLTCNSWYGKFHLEMHLWHHLGIIRFGLYKYVIPSLKWYLGLLDSSRKRAEEQGYQGIRLPKMTDPRGDDTPSNIGCLLIWQMPHLFIFLDEIQKQNTQAIDLNEYFPLLIGLVEFMSSFYYWKDGAYHLDSPLIPANENVEYDSDTPIFEECYTLYAFTIFLRWVKEYSISFDTTKILDILKHYVPLEIQNGCYEAFIGCKETYTKYNHDHPMIVGMYSYFASPLVEPKIIRNTLNKILDSWNLEDTWGWDFPMLSMVANRLQDRDLAIKILKMQALKNSYLFNGHNPQLPKQNLPIYLPGNGAFLLAISHIFK